MVSHDRICFSSAAPTPTSAKKKKENKQTSKQTKGTKLFYYVNGLKTDERLRWNFGAALENVLGYGRDFLPFFLWDTFYVLKDKVVGRGGSSIDCFISHMAARVRAGPDKSQEPGTSFRSPTRLQGLKDLGHSPLLSQALNMQLYWK